MKHKRIAIWLAWGLCIVTVMLSVTTIPLLLANRTQVFEILVPLPAWLAFAVVGALIITHQPRNTMGWLYCVIGMSATFYSFAQEYAAYTLITSPHALPGAMLLAWLGHNWTGSIGFFLLVLVVPLLFPDGRLPAPRWRVYGWLLNVAMTIFVIVQAFSSDPMSDLYPQIPNPFGIPWVTRSSYAIDTMIGAMLLGCSFLSFTSLIVRYRRAQQTERQQIKWLAYTAALIPLAALVSVILSMLQVNRDLDYWLTLAFWAPAYLGFPVATGIAILRYRLFAIDQLISRTLTYGVLTTLLALIYFGSVVVLGPLFPSLTHQRQSQVVTVFSTLVIAMLFTPLRRRVQDTIDRRFYRRKYDAEQVLAAFGETVRNETDLEQLTSALLAAIQETMQPTHVSLWLGKRTAPNKERRFLP